MITVRGEVKVNHWEVGREVDSVRRSGGVKQQFLGLS